jgi:hypothetical protein
MLAVKSFQPLIENENEKELLLMLSIHNSYGVRSNYTKVCETL